MPVNNANLLASIPAARWLLENNPRKIQIARVWPYLGIAGGSQSWARVDSFIGSAGSPISCSPIGESVDTATQVNFGFVELLTRYMVCFADQDHYRSPNDIDSVLYALAVRRLMYGYFAQLDLAGPGSPLSLRDKMDLTTRSVDMSGGPLTLDCLDHAYHLVDENEGRPSVIMTSSRGLRTYHSLCRNQGYDAPQIPFRWYDPVSRRMVGSWVTSFNGTPWLINDLMVGADDASPNEQRIYFIVLGDDSQARPTRGVTGIIPSDLKHRMFVKRATFGAPDPGGLGNPLPAQDVWVSWPVGVAVPSQAAISLIHNFQPVADCSVVGGVDA